MHLYTFRLNPNADAGRTKYEVRGKVTELCSKTTGWWIFKNTEYWFWIELNEDDLTPVRNQVRIRALPGPYSSTSVPGKIKYPISESEVGVYAAHAVGGNVKATLGVSSVADQFFGGQNAVSVMNIEFVGWPASA